MQASRSFSHRIEGALNRRKSHTQPWEPELQLSCSPPRSFPQSGQSVVPGRGPREVLSAGLGRSMRSPPTLLEGRPVYEIATADGMMREHFRFEVTPALLLVAVNQCRLCVMASSLSFFPRAAAPPP